MTDLAILTASLQSPHGRPRKACSINVGQIQYCFRGKDTQRYVDSAQQLITPERTNHSPETT
jgi:hypothetical protein